jgi:uncharacterized protein (DUF1786 family)
MIHSSQKTPFYTGCIDPSRLEAPVSTPVRILAVDVGTGTQDILLFESDKTIENCFQLIMPSPTVIMAERIKRATAHGQTLVLTGRTMGGGPCGWAARDHALAGHPAFATPDAARTFDDDLSMVEQMGIHIIEEREAHALAQQPNTLHLELQDFDGTALTTALRAFDVDLALDGLAIAAFDHGAAPPGVSDRIFRFNYIAETVRQRAEPAAFAYRRDMLPPDLTRLEAIAQSTTAYQQLQRSHANPSTSAVSQQPPPLLLMDTGSAAALGALDDPTVGNEKEVVLVNVGNFHTLAFHLIEGKIAGLFEHHTGLLDQSTLEHLLRKLVHGTLTNQEVFEQNGHGALLLSSPASITSGTQAFPFLAVTGPRRDLLRGSTLHPYEAVPHGDMMLAGCFGLLRAFADRYPPFAEAILTALNA